MDFFEYSDDEIADIALPIMETMKQGTNVKDYVLFSLHFSNQFRMFVDEEKFCSQVEKNIPLFGLLTEQEYLGLIRRESGVSIIYKQKTSNKNSELLGQLLLDIEGDDVKVFDACLR